VAPTEQAGVEVATRVVITLLLLASMLASVLFVVAYWNDWGNGWLGFAMGAALLCLGVSAVAFAHRVLPHAPHEEARESLRSSPDDQLSFALDFSRGGELGRRKFLWLGFAGAFGAFALAAIAPVRSFGPRPDKRLFHTPWRAGMRVVNSRGVPVRVDGVPIGGSMSVFPDGFVDSADGQAILIRVEPDAAARGSVKPVDGLLVYSTVCTHVGCPVKQYLAQRHELMCPCHQSVFDVLDGARPTFGPAGRPLPALPIAVGTDGIVTATGDFDAPVGPSFWNLR
jgi:ubiquinol-cytochrome c reductase iron-sulfur subunit